MNDNFYKGMTPAEYEALLVEGQNVWVPDGLVMKWLSPDDPERFPGVPTTARQLTSPFGQKANVF